MTKITYLPPQKPPKLLTASRHSLSLGEHRRAFLNANNKAGFLPDEEPEPAKQAAVAKPSSSHSHFVDLLEFTKKKLSFAYTEPLRDDEYRARRETFLESDEYKALLSPPSLFRKHIVSTRFHVSVRTP
jgi:hypothetical protein